MTRNERHFLKSNPSLAEAPLQFGSAFIPCLTVSGKKPHHPVSTFIQKFDLYDKMGLHASVFHFLTTGSKLLCAPHTAPT